MSTAAHLSPKHRNMLEVESNIAPAISAERGVRTVTRGRDLPDGFSRRQRQRAPGMLFSTHRPNGEKCYTFRPDEQDPKNPGHKYEQPCKAYGGPGNVLDVHPSVQHLIGDTNAPVIFTEGIKKADAITSAARASGVEVLVVAIAGVWNWLSGGEPIPDMLDIPVEGRRVTILFDSDLLVNSKVQDAARRLSEHLTSRGASVFVTYLPDQPSGSKMGADDFLASGGTLAEVRLLTRPYNPADFVAVRLSRDERLRLLVEDLERTLWSSEWRGQGGHTDRDIFVKLKEAAEQHGKVVDDGVRVELSHGTLALRAKVSTRTLWKSINRLEEQGLGYRDNEGRKPDRRGAFVLRASVRQGSTRDGQKGKATQELQTLYGRDLHLRAPRLRWSSPKWKPSSRTIRKARLEGRQIPEPRPAIKRLGKVRGAFLDALAVAGGTATIQEIAATLHRKRPRDIRRRNLPMLEEAGIISVEGDVVSLAADWLEQLDQVREIGREIEADEVARRRLAIKRRAYHSRHVPALQPEHAPTHEELAALEDARNGRRMRLALEALHAPGSGPAKNLELLMNGELHNVEYLVRSILSFHKAPAEMLERWRAPVLEAAAVLARERAPDPPPNPSPDWRTHPLECECADCLYPGRRYARPYRATSA